MTPRQLLAKIRKLLAAPELDGVRQGVELIAALDDPEIQATFCAGLSVDADGKLCWARSSEVARRVKADHRTWAALTLMRLSGDLASVERLDLRGREIDDLSVLEGAPGLSFLGLQRLQILQAPLEALPALRHLVVDGILGPADRLAHLQTLETLELTAMISAVDLGCLATLSQLRDLMLRGGRPLYFDALRALTGLRSLTLDACRGLTDLSFLRALNGLEHLTIREGELITDFSPLAALTNLRSLEICRQYRLIDLGPLAGLTRLERLRIEDSSLLRDLSPLAGLPALTRLELIRCAEIDGLDGLAGCAQIAEGVVVQDGRLCRDGQELSGWTLFAILATGAVDLSDVEHLALGRHRLADLSILLQAPRLKTLSLRSCGHLQAVWPILALGALEQVDITGSTQVRPRPRRTAMPDRGAVLAWQRQIARALERMDDRTAAQDALLETARQRGLLARQPPALRGDEAGVARVRRLLAGRSLLGARQGVAALESLGDAALIAELAQGVSIDARHRLAVDAAAARRAHLRKRERRGWAALAMLRLSGALDDVEILDVASRKLRVPDLTPLADLTTLRVLKIGNAHGLDDLSPLAGLSALEALSLSDAGAVRDLRPLMGLTNLEALAIAPGASLQDLSPLSRLVGLTQLVLRDASGLRDASAVRRLPNLKYLDMRGSRGLSWDTDRVYRSRAAIERLFA